MLRILRAPSRRRPYIGGAHLCALLAAVLLLLSVSVLHSRLGSFQLGLGLQKPPLSESRRNRKDLISPVESRRGGPQDDIPAVELLADEEYEKDEPSDTDTDDLIDEFDSLDEARVTVQEEDEVEEKGENSSKKVSGYYWDHVLGVTRRAFDKQITDDDQFGLESGTEDRSKNAFASDDQPLDEKIREKLDDMKGVEDALLLNTGRGRSALRDGWAPWFEQKAVFLRRDRMFRSNFEELNPLNNPLLQDPDMPGVASLTKGDKIMQTAIWKEIRKTPFPGSSLETVRASKKTGRETARRLNSEAHGKSSNKLETHIYADGRRWGYFPGLDPHLSFSDFMTQFFEKGNCSLQIFMVWNSPPWMFGVRHQRGVESVFRNHPDACVAVFSETIDLDFFNGFINDGFKIAVVMPNLDELLEDTPAHIFASVWHKWRKIPLYSIHYSELVRLAALYKYGGVYLDSDVIVLNPLNSLKNAIAVENEQAEIAALNGAVMAFKRHSPFIMECLREFYLTYDDTHLRWNGADLLARVSKRLGGNRDSLESLKLKIEPAFTFFPISPQDITRYFAAPADEDDKLQQDALFRKILNGSLTFHFWNSLTSSSVPELKSIAEKLINHGCLRCLDLL